MKANVLIISDPSFNEYKLLIENLDRYLEPLIEFDANICLHFDYNIELCEDIIDYARVRKFDFRASTKEDTILELKTPEYIIQNYDCAIIFTTGTSHPIRMLTDTMRNRDFKFRIVNYLKLNN